MPSTTKQDLEDMSRILLDSSAKARGVADVLDKVGRVIAQFRERHQVMMDVMNTLQERRDAAPEGSERAVAYQEAHDLMLAAFSIHADAEPPQEGTMRAWLQEQDRMAHEYRAQRNGG